MSWLVTGGAGYIGAHVVRAFQEVGLEAVVIDDLSSGHREFVQPEVPFVEGSIVDTELRRRDPGEVRRRGRRAPRRVQVRRSLGRPSAAHLHAERHRDDQPARGDGAHRRRVDRVLLQRRDVRHARRRAGHRGDRDAAGVAVRREQADRRVADPRPGAGDDAAAHLAALLQRRRLGQRPTSSTPARTTCSRSSSRCSWTGRRRGSTATTTTPPTAPACATTSTSPTSPRHTSSPHGTSPPATRCSRSTTSAAAPGRPSARSWTRSASVTGIDFTPEIGPRRPGDPDPHRRHRRGRGARPRLADAALARGHGAHGLAGPQQQLPVMIAA